VLAVDGVDAAHDPQLEVRHLAVFELVAGYGLGDEVDLVTVTKPAR